MNKRVSVFRVHCCLTIYRAGRWKKLPWPQSPSERQLITVSTRIKGKHISDFERPSWAPTSICFTQTAQSWNTINSWICSRPTLYAHAGRRSPCHNIVRPKQLESFHSKDQLSADWQGRGMSDVCIARTVQLFLSSIWLPKSWKKTISFQSVIKGGLEYSDQFSRFCRATVPCLTALCCSPSTA